MKSAFPFRRVLRLPLSVATITILTALFSSILGVWLHFKGSSSEVLAAVVINTPALGSHVSHRHFINVSIDPSLTLLTDVNLTTYKSRCLNRFGQIGCEYFDVDVGTVHFPIDDWRMLYRWFVADSNTENNSDYTNASEKKTTAVGTGIGDELLDVCIVTQVSLSRLQSMADGMCNSWNGPISVAFFIPKQTVDDSANDSVVLQSKLTELTEFIREKCPQISVASVLFGEAATDWYPINHLRNVALDQTSAGNCPFVFLLDSDFAPSFEMYDTLLTAAYQSLLRSAIHPKNSDDNMKSTTLTSEKKDLKKTDASSTKLFVVPALETKSKDSLNKMMTTPNGIDFAKSKWAMSLPRKGRVGIITQFHARTCKKCHAYTQFTQWLKGPRKNAKIENKLTYTYSNATYVRMKRKKRRRKRLNDTRNRQQRELELFEPYFIVERRGLHRYDARFKGYGFNKIVHFRYLLRCKNAAIEMMHFMSVTHLWHPPLDAGKLWRDESSALRNYSHALGQTAGNAINRCQDETGYEL